MELATAAEEAQLEGRRSRWEAAGERSGQGQLQSYWNWACLFQGGLLSTNYTRQQPRSQYEITF